MCGYADYSDGRLIPPDVNDREEESDLDAHERCTHSMACMSLLMRLNGLSIVGAERAARTMGCAECDQWEEWQ